MNHELHLPEHIMRILAVPAVIVLGFLFYTYGDLVTAAPHKRVVSNSDGRPPQFVLFAFDGSRRKIPMLRESVEFVDLMNASGKPIKFTYFINAANFISDDSARLYQGPHHEPGVTEIGFGGSPEDVSERLSIINAAVKQGSEVASHTVAHFHDADWSLEDWQSEFDSFNRFIDSIQKINAPTPTEMPLFNSRTVRGFRAPHLEKNAALYKVLSAMGFRYDASEISPDSRNWPYKLESGIWEIPLGTIRLGPLQSRVLSMDYNIWMHQSSALEVAVRGEALWKRYYDEVMEAYTDYFYRNYNSTRAPVTINNHVAVWNDGVYWYAMRAFASQVCGLPDVRCATYSELADYLDLPGAPKAD